ncbi:hypothetical protein EDD90_6388 [Streptomyces sp. Ag109_O5-1]|uniref:hypothetical protein n=1 Tax=Streptomyces TaxID=1883 RepID=UPI000F508A36|nr:MULTISPECIES: hypothetical protein [Streptomyces]RPE43198.1 hypothetical protein EDD90_6388 [Streptomyces sp. Ag109_O5-1]
MPEHASTFQLIGFAALTLATVAWAVVVTRLLRRNRREAIAWHAARTVPAFPHQHPEAGPSRESVELTPAEQDAFAGLVRRLGGR